MWNGDRNSAHRVAAAVALCAALTAGATQADYRALYIAGLRAQAEERWSDALTFFTESRLEADELDEDPRGELIRPYGTWTESYLPSYHRGRALYELGDYAEALEAWSGALAALEAIRRRGTSDHPLTFPRNSVLAAELAARVESIPGLVESRYRTLVRTLESVGARAEVLGRLLGERGGAEAAVALEGLPRRLEALRTILRERLSEATVRGGSDRRARQLREDEARLRSLLEELETLEAIRLSVMSVERIRLEEVGRDGRRSLSAAAKEFLARGDCDQALDTLRRLVSGREYGGLRPGDRISPFAQLSEASLACDRAAASGLYLRLAARFDHDEPSVELARRVGARQPGAVASDPEPGSADLRAVGAYVEALGWLVLGGCRAQPFSLLSSATETLLGRVDLGEAILQPLGLPFAPFLARALAHHNCANRAERDLELQRAESFRPAHARDIRRLRDELGAARPSAVVESSHALIISVWDYVHPEAWVPLSGAQEDIDPVRRALVGLGFNVLEPVENPTKGELKKALRDFAKTYGTDERNRLVVYYAGHGHTWRDPSDSKDNGAAHTNGYLVPSDAPPRHGADYLWDLLSMDELQTEVGLGSRRALRMRAHHAMFAFDTCFGGALFDELEGEVFSRLPESDLADLLDRPTRFFITAGAADQTVPNFSVFRRFLVSALEGDADADGDGIVMGKELGDFVRPLVIALSDPDKPNTPQWAWLAGSNADPPGDLGFERPRRASWPEPIPAAAPDGLESELNFWSSARCPSVPAECDEYLETFGADGWFALLAAQSAATNFQ